MVRSVQDPALKALRILATLFTWAFTATASRPAYVEGATKYTMFGRR
jgi:hypothetical protein